MKIKFKTFDEFEEFAYMACPYATDGYSKGTCPSAFCNVCCECWLNFCKIKIKNVGKIGGKMGGTLNEN